MAIRQKCLYCGQPVSQNGYCTSCRLNQEFLRKAFNTSEYHYNAALDRARSHDLSGAVDSLKMSLRYNKMNLRSRNLLGLVLYEMGEVVPALSQWVISMNYQPERNPAVRYLKELRDDPKELERASDAAREFNQALEHAKQHSLDLAQIALRKAVSINRHFIKGHLLMALIYMEQGRKGMARKCLSRVLTLDRTNITAQRYLREMGDSEEQIVRLSEQGEEEFDDLFDDYYGVETREGQRPARKIDPKTPSGKRRSVSVRQRFKESNLARYSNVYMFAGIIIGMLILYFLFIPGIRKHAEEDKESLEASYLKELSAKNSELFGLQMTVSESEKSVEKVEQEKEELEKKIASLEAQMAALKNQLAAGGAALLPDKKEGSSEQGEGATPNDDDRADETFDEDLPEGREPGEENGEARRADSQTEDVRDNGNMTVSELEAMIENE
ncbi:MAG: hypothetical protein IJM25_08015 [Eubacterium sp.]|jgi:tetratricopeptide (TPR) repeat protein|nr:hypothetical protein [Eubacterium sp.]